MLMDTPTHGVLSRFYTQYYCRASGINRAENVTILPVFSAKQGYKTIKIRKLEENLESDSQNTLQESGKTL